jgi:hypothetical protein
VLTSIYFSVGIMANLEEVARLRARFGYNNVLHPFSAAELKYLAPNEYKAGIAMDDDNAQEGIYSRVSSRFGFIPPNGEFEFGPQLTGDPACSFRAGLYGVSSTMCPTNIVTGRRPTIRRKAVGGYLADKVKCCTGVPDGDRTCDPKNNGPSASGCVDVYADICGKNPTDPRCATWGANNKAMYKQFLTDYCGRNIDSPACQEAILREGISVDAQYDLYCDSHPTVPFCSCRVPKGLPTPKYLEDYMAQTPSCFNGKCIAGGYKTAGQKNQAFLCEQQHGHDRWRHKR